jgi:hypothetical protein
MKFMVSPYDLREARRNLDIGQTVDGKLKALSDEIKSLAGRVKAIERFIEKESHARKTK